MTMPLPEDRIFSELVQSDSSYAELVEEFVSGLDDQVHSMWRSLADGQFDTLKSLAYQLKGVGGDYGYQILTEVAASLEQRARHQELQACQTSLEELTSIVSRVAVTE